jgi:hypothetical protein
MPRNDLLLMWALLAQVLLTAGIYLVLLQRKRRAFAERSVDRARMALHADAWPDPVQQANNNLRNQFELPVLFFVLVLLILQLGRPGLAAVVLAWLFVVLRYVHAWVHVGRNVVPLRRNLFALGAVAILGLVIVVAWRLVMATT